MSGEENAKNAKPVNVDPQCIQEALRMYLQPIKNEDPQLDFYTMYKRETVEYDTEYMQKHNEDLNTTLIFAGLFSAVSSAFVIDVQSKLQPDSSERSEVYLRAILLSLNRSAVPGEDPTAPPAWNGPPAEIVTTSNLLYASLLMSLLAAFIAMLGKQWLNRYLRHTGGSMVERCGDRQRKFDGLKKWPFRLFIEILPIMLQIALLLLSCGLSRYVWSVNASVARVVISFTVLGVLFYVGIVVAGTSSYECPFQTPASTVLRQIGGSRVGHQAIALLLWANQVFGNMKHRLARCNPRARRRARLLPFSFRNVARGLAVPRNGLRLRVWNLENILRQNTDNARCVCWVLRNITDPEAIDSAIRLAGTIRWFDGDADHNPPFDLIVSTFEACFDSTKQLHPGMRDRAYFSARAILRINTGARAQSDERAFKYPIPAISSSSSRHPDPDFHHILCMLERIFVSDRPTLDFPMLGVHSLSHSLWMSNLFIDLTRVGPNPPMKSYQSYLNAAATNHRATIANTLVVWYILLGGYVEEETLWPVNKSDSLETILSHLSARMIYMFDHGLGFQNLYYLLEFLATWEKRPAYLTPMAYRWCSAISEAAGRLRGRGVPIIEPRDVLKLELRVRPARPVRPRRHSEPQSPQSHSSTQPPKKHPRPRRGSEPYLGETQTIFGGSPTTRGLPLLFISRPQEPEPISNQRGLDLLLRQDPAPGEGSESTPSVLEEEFSTIGPDCNPLRWDRPPDYTPRPFPPPPPPLPYAHLLSVALEIGFRLAAPDGSPSATGLGHTSQHDWMFETAFSSRDDEVIADAVCARIAAGGHLSPGWYVRRFAKRVERDTPFSPRLREVGIRAIEPIWHGELKVSVYGTVRLLNRLDIELDDVEEKSKLGELLAKVIRSPTGIKHLSPHYWRLMEKLALVKEPDMDPASRGVVVRWLEEAGDWEKLEPWMAMAWRSVLLPRPAEDVERVTLELFLRRPPALLRFENLCETDDTLSEIRKVKLRQICEQARTGQPPSEAPPSRISPLDPVPFPGDDTP